MHCILLFGLFILFKSVTILPPFVVVSHSIFLKSPDQLYCRMFHILDFFWLFLMFRFRWNSFGKSFT